MIIPIRTDRRLQHTPWVNYALIATNVVAFLLTKNSLATPGVSRLMLQPMFPAIDQFITYQFLHADWMHLIGNMLFLYIFGNSVEDRLGKVGYIAFYLAGGVMAGYGHAMIDESPVLGASGAVAGVSGAYLALFPKSNVTILYIIFFIGFFELPSMWLIGFYIAKDVLFQMMGTPGVAYMAHVAGYAFGFAIGMGLLATRLLPREPYDMLTLIEQMRRRNQFKSMTKRGYQPWSDAPVGHVPQVEQDQKPPDARQRLIMTLRERVSRAANHHDLPGAATAYLEVLEVDDQQVLGQQLQLEVANQLMQQGQYKWAAHAYELFLKTYGSYPHREQVQLILGVVYARYLEQASRASQLLNEALPRLHDQDQKDLARQLLAQVAG